MTKCCMLLMLTIVNVAVSKYIRQADGNRENDAIEENFEMNLENELEKWLDKDTEANLWRRASRHLTHTDSFSFSFETDHPSPLPSATPITDPTSAPTSIPTTVPTGSPTISPTSMPTGVPTGVPTSIPTGIPTSMPTSVPTGVPTSIPSSVPTSDPTTVPTDTPISCPTTMPTGSPTGVPTNAPTSCPTSVPTSVPTADPSATPTSVPTVSPTGLPSGVPTSIPIGLPTGAPTSVPTGGPTSIPTTIPTSVPTSAPTNVPTSIPTVVPSASPTNVPTAVPASTPTSCPTAAPTASPSAVPSASPTMLPTAIPSQAPSTLPTSLPTSIPSASPTAVPTPVPTPVCPTWAQTSGCEDDNCLCCTSYNVTRDANGTIDGGARKVNSGSRNCLMCIPGYDCIDHDGDGDGECIENSTGFVPGNNLCDWWLWAWYYGPEIDGRDTPNGHLYPTDSTLDKDYYIIGGQNCSAKRIDIISATAPGRYFDDDGDGVDDYHACNGLFSFGNDTRYASGHPDYEHDREGSICYEDYRGATYRGYCSYMVGPSACVRCSPYDLDSLIVSSTLSMDVNSDKSIDELNEDEDFKLAMRSTIFYASGLDNYPDLTDPPYTYVQDLEFVASTSRTRRLLAVRSVDALYNIVVSASAITIAASEFYEDVETLAETAIDSGTFTSTLSDYLINTYNITSITVNATAIYTEVLQTVPPTYWSVTADVVLPTTITRRLGGGGNEQPACGCDEDEDAGG
mmetsp:Transcript_2544/g.3419  ORF Transcript_2544/g.3419 Transcript_2544/m.3419 type:complete len:740 (-) Transcript_2544:348-2567(-)